MIHIWKNTYNESIESMSEFFARTLKDQHDKDIFNMLWFSFRLSYIIKSTFFESIRVGDNKYSLWVHKSHNGIITVKFIIL